MQTPKFLNVKIIGCGIAGGSLAAMLPVAWMCGIGAGLV